MMKKIKFLPLIFLMIASLMGCSFGIKNNKKYVTLYVSVDDFENSKNGRAVIVPKTDDSDLYTFTLKAKKSGESSYLELTNFQEIKYNTLINTSLSLETGTWDFLLEAYVTFDGISYLAASAEKTNEEITADRAAPISFTLNLSEADSDAKGGYKFDVSFQNTNVKLVKANCYKDANLTQQVESTTEFTEAALQAGNFTLKNYALSAGYYYLQLLFYSDEAGTEKLAGRIISFKIVPYFVTSDTITYSDSFEKLQVYKIEYKDAGDSKFTGVKATDGKALDTIKFNASSSVITLPQSSEISSSLNSDDNPIIFEGWYKNPGCTAPVSGFSQTELMNAVDNIPVYAKWSYKYVYLDPAAPESNNGVSTGSPVKTVQEAKYRLGRNSEAVYVLSSISDADDIKNISGITTTSTNNAVLKRYSSFTDDPVIKVTTAIGDTITDVTIDGGALDSVNATSSLVSVAAGSVTFGDNVAIQNNNSSTNGGGISITDGGNVTVTSPSFIIKNNKTTAYGGGVYINGINSEFNFESGTIKENTAKNGGAISSSGNNVITIKDSKFLGNKSIIGPAISLNQGSLELLGNINFENNTITSTSDKSDIYISNGYLKLYTSDFLTLPEGNTCIISPDKYPSVGDKKQVIKDTNYLTSDQRAKLSSLFTVADNPAATGVKYKVNEDGNIVCDQASGGGTVETPDFSSLGFKASKTSINNTTDSEITITPYWLDNPDYEFTDTITWNSIKLMLGTTEVSDSYYSVSDNKVTINTGLYAGSYKLVISATVKGVIHTGSVSLTVTSGNSAGVSTDYSAFPGYEYFPEINTSAILSESLSNLGEGNNLLDYINSQIGSSTDTVAIKVSNATTTELNEKLLPQLQSVSNNIMLDFSDLDGSVLQGSNLTWSSIKNTLVAVILPKNLAKIPSFQSCEKLETVSIPGPVSSMVDSAFQSCESLENVCFSDNVTMNTITRAAFAQCTSLESITIPASVNVIYPMAFIDCINLKTIEFAAGKGKWGKTYSASGTPSSSDIVDFSTLSDSEIVSLFTNSETGSVFYWIKQ